ncbi:DNA phosphorothioation-dependent restriction protein DptF [Bacillus subtilis]|uniref:DNA phosphorothioation-dependent restriction protein DptF n=1 Tax=Bacillus subtilis TaxID=1423 RepID=UPI003C7C222B
MGNSLIKELGRLKQSSKEAVENIESYNKFKQYMHVERPFERSLIHIMERIREQKRPHLVMVCGSVGDGKSHLISYLKNNYPGLFHNVTIHNDATESFSPTKTSIETLRNILNPFTDDNLSIDQNDMNHVVVAINLGTLNNFLHSEYGSEFMELQRYVEDKKILEEGVTSSGEESEERFQFVNLSDYHLYELAKDGVQSGFLEALFEKITAESPDNPFYEKYKLVCSQEASLKDECPVVKNYELLMNRDVQKSIVYLLAELMIKYKMIVSPRMFLDFIYRILVPDYIQDSAISKALDNKNKDEIRERYLKSLLPNLLFDLGKRSEAFLPIETLGSLAKRNQLSDKWIISFFITDNISSLTKDIVPESLLEQLNLNNSVGGFDKKQEGRELILKTLLRLRAISGVAREDEQSTLFPKFLTYLFYWNTHNVKELRTLYYDVIEAIYNWNGKTETERINMFVGRNQLKYAISQKIVIKPHLEQKEVDRDERLSRFLNYMVLKFKVEGSDQIYSISIDFNLFELIVKMKNGYRPNSRDKNNFINFANFADRMIKENVQQDNVVIREKVSQDSKQYILTVDEFGYEFKEK